MSRSLRMIAPLVIGLLAGWPAPPTPAAADSADSIEAAIQSSRRDVEQAVAELNALRDRIRQDREPLAVAHAALEATVRDRRRAADRQRTLKQMAERERMALMRELQELEAAEQFLRAVSQDYRRAMETRVGAAEARQLAEPLAALDRAWSTRESSTVFSASIGDLLTLAELGARRRVGGFSWSGTCLAPDGTELTGQFAAVGPATYFSAAGHAVAGLAVARPGSLEPSLYTDLDGADISAIVNLVNGEEAIVPVDVAGGDALRVARASATIRERVASGGFTMAPLLLIGVVAAVLSIWKFLSLRGIRLLEAAELEQLLDALRRDDVARATERVASLDAPLSPVLEAGIAYRDARRETLEEIMHERALGAIPNLDRHLGMIAVLGGVAPLLGLLGTVTGMIHTFQLVTVFGSGDARLLSSGISEALITTETGLVIAVPVLLIHALLTRRVRTIVAHMEQTVIGFVNGLHREAGPHV
ncbi:MAG: MotA/TolQ/ExbB proton channel family protein [Verrucomicrobia bacterium]|nr:MotA/TolQ/ExbB proton channel family protein [Verrucomicrobiota bacterium]